MLKEIKESAKNINGFSRKINNAIKTNPDLLNQIIEETKFLNDCYEFIPLNQRVYHLWNGIDTVEVCPFCGKPKSIRYDKKNTFVFYIFTCASQICKSAKIKSTCEERYGVSSVFQSKIIKDKMKNTWIKNYGEDNPSKSKIIKEKKIITSLKNYGEDNPNKSKIVKEKSKSTCLVKYGVESVNQVEEFNIKKRKTLFKNYGVNNPNDSKLIRDKSKATCLKNHGVEYSLQSKLIRDKIKATCLQRYGVEHPSQSEEIFSKQQRWKRKPYNLPSGKIVKTQGYEHIYLDYYFSIGGLEENVQCEKIKAVPYTLNGKKHRYHPDIYLKNEHKIIEVKSNWWFLAELEENIAKKNTCIEQGYGFEFFIYDAKGKRLSEEELINKS